MAPSLLFACLGEVQEGVKYPPVPLLAPRFAPRAFAIPFCLAYTLLAVLQVVLFGCAAFML